MDHMGGEALCINAFLPAKTLEVCPCTLVRSRRKTCLCYPFPPLEDKSLTGNTNSDSLKRKYFLTFIRKDEKVLVGNKSI